MITRMNHAVLYVRDARTQQRFYADVLGFATIVADKEGRYAFMRAPNSSNHHDIAFFTIGASAAPSTAGRTSVGLYHIAWEVATIDDLHRMLMKLPVGVPAVVTLLRGGRKLERMVIPADYPER